MAQALTRDIRGPDLTAGEIWPDGPRPHSVDAVVAADDYQRFLEGKIRLAANFGIEVDPAEVNPILKPHQRAIVLWALRGGRRAIFASFGLGKTFMQLEILRLVVAHLSGRLGPAGIAPNVLADPPAAARALLVAPLGVRQEFMGDVRALATGEHPAISAEQRAELAAWQAGRPDRVLSLTFIRSDAEASGPGVYMTNYETVREGKLDVMRFAAASLDEAAILRGFGGSKTFREFMRLFDGMRWKWVATACPSPNEYIEMLVYSAFLEVMDIGQAKTRFFKRNSEQADKLTLHPHKEREFWLWVASWALFITKPSDLGSEFSDAGYDLPPLEVHWHEIATDHRDAGSERGGQYRLLREDAVGVVQASREKRHSLSARIAKMMEIREIDPGAHRIIWHDLEAERLAIEAAIPGITSVYGSQALEQREEAIVAFSNGRFQELATKPMIAGAGCNFQRHCAWAIYLGIGHKFHDFIQSIHRLLRFLQTRGVRIDLIYTEAERPLRQSLEAKWRRHEEQLEKMTEIIRQYGLSHAAMAQELVRAIGVQRVEVTGDGYRLINNDCVRELARMANNSVDIIVTSIPFGTQYEYSANYADFGHTDDIYHFLRQMDYLIPELLRVLKPGRNCAIHVKDRIVPGGMTGLGFQTVYPFSDDIIAAFKRHGWAFLSRRTIVTDVVRENNQTYRLGWSEQCKDGSRMGAGMPEYLLVFRKPPTDASNGYADNPVRKPKKYWRPAEGPEGNSGTDDDADYGIDDDGSAERATAAAGMPEGSWDNPNGYSRARWQLDAAGFWRSAGNRLLTPQDLVGLAHDQIYQLWKARNLQTVYDFEHHVMIGESMEMRGALPSTFMLLPPHSPHPDVWSDVARMLTMNTLASAKGREMHLCPLQFDIIDRTIAQMSEPGEVVLDPFGGLMSVPYRAIKLKRKSIGIELSPAYFLDGVAYCEAMAREMAVPTLFDLIEFDACQGRALAAGQTSAEAAA